MSLDSFQSRWKTGLDTTILDKHMDVAMKRVAGTVGVDIAFEKGFIKTRSKSGMIKFGRSIRPDDISQAILTAFHAGAKLAFVEAKEALDTKALSYLKRQGLDEERRLAVLGAAGTHFAMPPVSVFHDIGNSFAKASVSPGIQTGLGGATGFLLVFMLTGAPQLAAFSGILIGGSAYYLARGRTRRRAEELMRDLPHGLYGMLVNRWNQGLAGYADRISEHAVSTEVEAFLDPI